LLLLLFVFTCTEQSGNIIGDAVKREITQGLVEGHGVDKGIAVAGACAFYDFETCEEISLSNQMVRCMCGVFDVCRVQRCALVVDLPLLPTSSYEPHTTRCNS
jgi:hypothetical protein